MDSNHAKQVFDNLKQSSNGSINQDKDLMEQSIAYINKKYNSTEKFLEYVALEIIKKSHSDKDIYLAKYNTHHKACCISYFLRSKGYKTAMS